MKNHISRIQIMGDIHSGTKWLYRLVGQNVNKDVEIYGDHRYSNEFKSLMNQLQSELIINNQSS